MVGAADMWDAGIDGFQMVGASHQVREAERTIAADAALVKRWTVLYDDNNRPMPNPDEGRTSLRVGRVLGDTRERHGAENPYR